jgi:hypothetical protein
MRKQERKKKKNTFKALRNMVSAFDSLEDMRELLDGLKQHHQCKVFVNYITWTWAVIR